MRTTSLQATGLGITTSEQCNYDTSLPRTLLDIDGNPVDLTYTAPVLDESPLPALFGLQSLIDNEAIWTTQHNCTNKNFRTSTITIRTLSDTMLQLHNTTRPHTTIASDMTPQFKFDRHSLNYSNVEFYSKQPRTINHRPTATSL